MLHTIQIKENYLFKRLYRVGKSAAGAYIAVYVKKNGLKINRLGITTSKKIGGAVQRNRAKRIIKEAYRLLEKDLPQGYDFVIVARAKSVYAKMQDVKKCLNFLLIKLTVLNKNISSGI